MKRRRSIALLVETSNAYARGLLEGIIDYNQHHDRWSLILPEQDRGASPPNWLDTWDGDGIIARVETDEIARAVERINCPVVDVSASRRLPGIPWVEADDDAVAKMGVAHLKDRGFKNLAFCGDSQYKWSQLREETFCELVDEPHIFRGLPRRHQDYGWQQERNRLAQWLNDLPKPVGVLVCYDIMAQQVVDLCRELEISVPEEAAILGVDNDTLLCGVCDPPLSSIICNTYRAGYQAAGLLDRMMAGEEVGAEGFLLKPTGIKTRQSTDILAIDDADVAAAVSFIRENACSGINVSHVLRAVPLSRRVLEKRFVQILGRTPHDEITRLKINRVKQLLTETNLSLSEIAKLAGYRHDEYLSVAFKKAVGVQPSKYRHQERSERAPS